MSLHSSSTPIAVLHTIISWLWNPVSSLLIISPANTWKLLFCHHLHSFAFSRMSDGHPSILASSCSNTHLSFSQVFASVYSSSLYSYTYHTFHNSPTWEHQDCFTFGWLLIHFSPLVNNNHGSRHCWRHSDFQHCVSSGWELLALCRLSALCCNPLSPKGVSPHCAFSQRSWSPLWPTLPCAYLFLCVFLAAVSFQDLAICLYGSLPWPPSAAVVGLQHHAQLCLPCFSLSQPLLPPFFLYLPLVTLVSFI